MIGHDLIRDVGLMPDKPAETPLNWEQASEDFCRFVLEPDNGALYYDEEGNLCFKAFLEGEGKELITFGGIMLGMILKEKDVSAFVPALLSYYNEKIGMFLNNRNGERIEYWYLMHANALAGEIITRHLSNNRSYVDKWLKSADNIREMAHIINYDFNDQGFDFRSKKTFTLKDSYRQPDTVGGFAYIMLLAYKFTKNEVYLGEAEKALKLYEAFEENPWYEIPSGARACISAAYLQSIGKACNIEKIVNFALDSTEGCLQTGMWGDKEVNGLMMGWRGYTREEASSTAYSLESLVLMPFLLPVLNYDVRFANSMGKYVLNAAANNKLFFSEYLPEDFQSRPDLPKEVPYEKLYKQYEKRAPYAAGDFFSHKSVYGGTFLIWWGALIKRTSDEYILGLNISKTNFLEDSNTNSILYYNPYDEEKDVSINLEDGTFSIYEMPAMKLIAAGVKENFNIKIEANSSVIIKFVPEKEA